MTKEEVLRRHIYNYIKPSFPNHNHDELASLVSSYLVITEEKEAILSAMEEYASIRVQEAFEAGYKHGREEALFDHSILERHECTEPNFKDWRKEK